MGLGIITVNEVDPLSPDQVHDPSYGLCPLDHLPNAARVDEMGLRTGLSHLSDKGPVFEEGHVRDEA